MVEVDDPDDHRGGATEEDVAVTTAATPLTASYKPRRPITPSVWIRRPELPTGKPAMIGPTFALSSCGRPSLIVALPRGRNSSLSPRIMVARSWVTSWSPSSAPSTSPSTSVAAIVPPTPSSSRIYRSPSSLPCSPPVHLPLCPFGLPISLSFLIDVAAAIVAICRMPAPSTPRPSPFPRLPSYDRRWLPSHQMAPRSPSSSTSLRPVAVASPLAVAHHRSRPLWVGMKQSRKKKK